jgi:hypothetical protein
MGFWGLDMKLSSGDLRLIIEKDFSGDLLYMPLLVTGDSLPRPVAQLTLHPRIPPEITDFEPRSLTRKQSVLHLKGLLHHDPAIPARAERK